jgi:hypothetical protein
LKVSNLIPRLKNIFNIKVGRVMDRDGNQSWHFSNFKQHRDNDLPAYLGKDGSKEWWKYGLRHRANGLPAVEGAAGTREWWVEGKLHREDGPAVERMDGTKEWWVNGKRHREDGPAIERPDGNNEWFRNDEAWPQGNKVTPAIQQEQKEKAVEQVVQNATVAPEEVRLFQPIKFKKPTNTPSL